MLARCARCQNTFTTDRFGLQKCPSCGSELMLADPNAPVSPGGSSLGSGPQGGPTLGMSGTSPGGSALDSGPQAGPPGPGEGGGLPPIPPPPPGGWPPPPGGGGFGPPPGPPPGGELPSPFAERARLGWFGAFFETWKLVATRPQEFFARVRVDQSGSAVLFGVIASTVGNVVAGLYGWLAGQQTLVAMQEMMGQMPEEQRAMFERVLPYLSGNGTLWQLLFAPIFAAVGIYVGAAILHLLLMLFRGTSRGFEATLTVVGHAYGLYLLMVVPACGGLVAMIWILVVLVVGLAAAHRCGQGKSAAAVLLPLVLACCCCFGALGLGAASFLKALGGSHGGPLEL